jgi:hypothetical protein
MPDKIKSFSISIQILLSSTLAVFVSSNSFKFLQYINVSGFSSPMSSIINSFTFSVFLYLIFILNTEPRPGCIIIFRNFLNSKDFIVHHKHSKFTGAILIKTTRCITATECPL